MMTSSTATMPDDDNGPSPARRRSLGRRIGMVVYGVVAGVIVLALIAAGAGVWIVQRSFPQRDGTVAVAGLDAETQVLRDDLGIATVIADTPHDLFFTQGYVHAQDRFWEMDFRRHVTSGRLSELFGASQLPTDQFLRTLGWHRVAEEEVAALDATTRAYYDAYAEGVNAYLADHRGADASLEYAVLGLQNPDYEIEPWTPADSVAWLKAMAWDLRTNLEDETERALLAADGYTGDQLAELYPEYPFDRNPVIVPELTTAASSAPAAAPASVSWSEADGVIEAVSALVKGAGEGVGSNSWVVSGELTSTGLPLLANDPHLGASLPSVWHQIGLKCRTVTPDCRFDVSGFGFSGLPGVVIGHNDRVAWGFTNLTTDVTDLYLEKIEGDSYWRDGALVPLEERTETFRVAGGEDVELTVRSTVHGPIISGLTPDMTAIADDPHTGSTGVAEAPADAPEGETAVSLQWTALDPGTTPAAVFALNLAQNWEDFRAAAAAFTVPAQNLLYADVDGNIGYQTPGRLPVRGAGDGTLPQPGWDSRYDWQSDIPFADLPSSLNPASGYIVTANNAIVDQSYPYFLTRDWDYGWRAARITDLLQRAAADGALTADDLRGIQADDDFWMGRRLVTAYADVSTGEATTDAALQLLQSWDAQNDADSAAAAYANVLWDELAQDLFVRGRAHPGPVSDQGRLFLVVDRLLDDPDAEWWTNESLGVDGQEEMLAHAATEAAHRLSTLQGSDPSRWNWGRLHALPLESDTFGSSGIAPIEWLFNRGPFPVGGGSSVVNATGWAIGEDFATVTVPSMRMVVDLSDFDASEWNQLTGNSGHAFHPNYIDQTAAWQAGELTPWAFSGDAVRAAATHELSLRPAD